MARKKVENRNVAKREKKEILRETDKAGFDAQVILDDLEKVTKGLEGILKGGISEKDNRKLEELVKDAAFIASKEFEKADVKREKILRIGEEWRDIFYEAARDKEVDEKNLELTIGKMKSSFVKRIVRKAVEHTREEKVDYRNDGIHTDKETKKDREYQRMQKNKERILKSINVKVG